MPRAAPARALALWVRAYYPAVYVKLASQISGRKFGAIGQDVPDSSTDIFSASFDVSPTEVGLPLDNSTVFDTVNPNTGAIASVSANYTLPDITAPADPSASAADLGPTQPPASAISPTVASPSVLSNVGAFLTTGGGLTSLLNVGSAVINNQTSQNVLRAQVARVSAGYNPAAIGYSVNPTTGTVQPILQSTAPGVAYPVTPQVLQQIAPNAATVQLGNFVSRYFVWILLGGLVLAIA